MRTIRTVEINVFASPSNLYMTILEIMKYVVVYSVYMCVSAAIEVTYFGIKFVIDVHI